MDDNPSLSESVKQRYQRMYTGVFYQRFILGRWVLADGIVYDMFEAGKHMQNLNDRDTSYDRVVIGIDYGTRNPTSFLKIGITYSESNDRTEYHVLDEYYYDGRKNKQRTDEEHYEALVDFAEGTSVDAIYIDPSAASFITTIQRYGEFTTIQAKNDVLDGIRTVASLLSEDRLYVDKECKSLEQEFGSYIWDERAQNRGVDKPIKDNDHALDALRYVVYTIESAVKVDMVSVEEFDYLEDDDDW